MRRSPLSCCHGRAPPRLPAVPVKLRSLFMSCSLVGFGRRRVDIVTQRGHHCYVAPRAAMLPVSTRLLNLSHDGSNAVTMH